MCTGKPMSACQHLQGLCCRGYGGSARATLTALRSGTTDYERSGTHGFPEGSFANGGAMRIAPVGLAYRSGPQLVLTLLPVCRVPQAHVVVLLSCLTEPNVTLTPHALQAADCCCRRTYLSWWFKLVARHLICLKVFCFPIVCSNAGVELAAGTVSYAELLCRNANSKLLQQAVADALKCTHVHPEGIEGAFMQAAAVAALSNTPTPGKSAYLQCVCPVVHPTSCPKRYQAGLTFVQLQFRFASCTFP